VRIKAKLARIEPLAILESTFIFTKWRIISKYSECVKHIKYQLLLTSLSHAKLAGIHVWSLHMNSSGVHVREMHILNFSSLKSWQSNLLSHILVFDMQVPSSHRNSSKRNIHLAWINT